MSATEKKNEAVGLKRLILVVEDLPEAMLNYLVVARELGCDFVAVENGRDALDRIREGLRPSVILLDLVMPVMDGVEFLKELSVCGKLNVAPVILTSDSPEGRDVVRAYKLFAYAPKSVHRDELKAVITAALHI